MKFVVNQQQLSNALAFVSSAIQKKSTIPVLCNVLLSCDQGQLTLAGSGEGMEKKTSIDCEVEETGSVTVPAAKLSDFAKNADPEKPIKFQLKGDKAVISSGRSKWTLSTLPADHYPEFSEIENGKAISVDIDSLIEAIKKCSPAMAQQDVRYYLNGMLFDISDAGLAVVATDGHRLMMFDISSQCDFIKQAIVPKPAVSDVLKMITKGGDAIIEVAEKCLKVTSGNSVMYTTLIDGKYPDYKRVIPQSNSIQVSANAEELFQALKRTIPLASGVNNTKPITLDIEGGELYIKAKNTENEKAVEVIPVACDTDVSVSFEGTYLLDAIGNIDGDNVTIQLKDANSAALVAEEEMTAVVMPLRV